jgi:hypothetical protein
MKLFRRRSNQYQKLQRYEAVRREHHTACMPGTQCLLSGMPESLISSKITGTGEISLKEVNEL